jgi:hypothetical protein
VLLSGLHAGAVVPPSDPQLPPNGAEGDGLDGQGAMGRDAREPGVFLCARGLASLGCGGPHYLRNLVVELYGASRLAEMIDEPALVKETLRKHEVCVVYALPACVLAPSTDPLAEDLRVVRRRLLQTFADTTIDSGDTLLHDHAPRPQMTAITTFIRMYFLTA